MNGDIIDILKCCDRCQRTNTVFIKSNVTLHSIPVISQVWHSLNLFYFNSLSEISLINVQEIILNV